MTARGLTPSHDLSAAAWIAPRLGGAFGAVTRAVPHGYPAYARICHPPADTAGALTTWSHVARTTGRVAHPLMQWHALAGCDPGSSASGLLWPGAPPRVGHLVPEVLGPLCAVLAGFTTTPEDCSFGVWDGWGWIGSDDDSPLSLLPGAQRAAVVRLPARDYLLLAGPVEAALQLGYRSRPDWFLPQSPSIFWPSDRAWFTATEIDFDSTLVGGSGELVAALLAAPALDAWPVDGGDSLAIDADTRNPAV